MKHISQIHVSQQTSRSKNVFTVICMPSLQLRNSSPFQSNNILCTLVTMFLKWSLVFKCYENFKSLFLETLPSTLHIMYCTLFHFIHSLCHQLWCQISRAHSLWILTFSSSGSSYTGNPWSIKWLKCIVTEVYHIHWCYSDDGLCPDSLSPDGIMKH
jgi:hypothetical protein